MFGDGGLFPGPLGSGLYKKALDKKSKSTANPSRQDLINKALAIHKSQSHIFDDLPEDQRQKLKLIAFQAFGEQLKNS